MEGQVMEITVLVVDDDQDVADSSTMLLVSWGCETRTVYTGAAAVASAMDQPPRLAVVDINMPVMDGYEVARQLRALPDGDGMHLAAVTGAPGVETAERAAVAGFDTHHAKPLSAASVADLLTLAARERP